MISGGYYIKARKIQESEISVAAPCVRELWDWLLREANHTEKKYGGYEIKRGQLFRTIRDMRDGLKWMVGYRTERYNEDDMKNAMKWLRSRLMITTTKTPRGNIITICNYDVYQNAKNYESPDENPMECPCDAPVMPELCPSINKNDKNVRMKEINNNNKPIPIWVDNFEEYRAIALKGAKALLLDSEWVKKRESFHPRLNIQKSIQKAFEDFWGLESGWEHKKKACKKKNGEYGEINWKTTYQNALTFKSNQVWKTIDDEQMRTAL